MNVYTSWIFYRAKFCDLEGLVLSNFKVFCNFFKILSAVSRTIIYLNIITFFRLNLEKVMLIFKINISGYLLNLYLFLHRKKMYTIPGNVLENSNVLEINSCMPFLYDQF